MTAEFGWTIVQHSGFGYGGKPGFEHAVETVALNRKSEKTLVESVNGIIFPTYRDASVFEEQANYPAGTEGIYPDAKGTFSEKRIIGLRIYIPVRNAIN